MVRIFLESELKKRIAKETGRSLQLVYRALNGETETQIAYLIRARALELGGTKLRRLVSVNDPAAENGVKVN
jgi:hypothetical protein